MIWYENHATQRVRFLRYLPIASNYEFEKFENFHLQFIAHLP